MKEQSMRKILITGGMGLIGQAIASYHIDAGDDVYLFDVKVNKFNDYSKYVGKDITASYEGNLGKTIKTIQPDIISHQAALVGVGQSQYDIHRYVEYNIGFTGYLLQSLLDVGFMPKKFIHAGSMGPYGNATFEERVFETQPQNPMSVYAVTKQAQENLIRVFSEAYEMNTISLRYFSVYGTEQNPLNPYTGVLSIIANQCLNSEKIEIYDDGSQTRDLVHIDDVANAHFLASHTDIPGFMAMNIGTEISHSMMDIAVRIRDILAPDKEIVLEGVHRKGDIMHMKANTSRARKLLGWKPNHELYDDIQQYCAYVLANRERFTFGNTIKDENENILKKGLVTNARP